MSYALMRRFAFIEVGTPTEEAYQQLLDRPGRRIVAKLLPLRQLNDLGPAVYLDAAQVRRRAASRDGVTESRVLLRGLLRLLPAPVRRGRGERRATTLYRLVAEHLDPVEQLEAQRTIAEVLGVELARLSRTHGSCTPVDGAADRDRRLWRRLGRPFALAERSTRCSACDRGGRGSSRAAVVCSCTEADRAARRDGRRSCRCAHHVGAERPIRSRGEVRGPVLWSETMSARPPSFGDPDLFVCTSPQRDYDTAENRVLVRALRVLGRWRPTRSTGRPPPGATTSGLKAARRAARAALHGSTTRPWPG